MTGANRARVVEWIRAERAAGRIQREAVMHAAERCSREVGFEVKGIELRKLWYVEMNREALKRSAERAKGLQL